MEKEIIEWCPKCGIEVKIGINGGKCSCGNFLLPCSNCDMNKVICSKCKFKKNI